MIEIKEELTDAQKYSLFISSHQFPDDFELAIRTFFNDTFAVNNIKYAETVSENQPCFHCGEIIKQNSPVINTMKYKVFKYTETLPGKESKTISKSIPIKFHVNCFESAIKAFGPENMQD